MVEKGRPPAGVITIPGPKKPLTCIWTPAPSPIAIVLLTHGASGDASSGNLPLFASTFAAAGLSTLSFTARGPLASRAAAFRAAGAWAGAQDAGGVLFLAGHSMGARAAAAASASWNEEEEGDASRLPPLAGLILLSYPLHPPGEPAKASQPDRGGLLLALEKARPVLAVRGDRDPFSTQPAWSCALARAAGAGVRVEERTVVEGDHGLGVKGGGSGAAAEAAAASAAWAAARVGEWGGRETVRPGAPAPEKRRRALG